MSTASTLGVRRGPRRHSMHVAERAARRAITLARATPTIPTQYLPRAATSAQRPSRPRHLALFGLPAPWSRSLGAIATITVPQSHSLKPPSTPFPSLTLHPPPCPIEHTGGGYIYRLCPANEPLTEECFFRTPLEFIRSGQELEWANGTRYPIKGTWVDEGTYPKGSTWAMNPIPRINFDSHSSGQPAGASGCETSPVTGGATGPNCMQFKPPCPQDSGVPTADPKHKGTDKSGQGACSGDWTAGSIVDQVRVPADLKPGDYVLGWRWDCEESTQVWSACADVTVVAK